MSMMQQSPEDEVRAAVLAIAKNFGCSLTARAIGSLVGPARNHFRANPGDYPIDVSRLNEQLLDIFERVRKNRGPLKGETLDKEDFDAVLPTVAVTKFTLAVAGAAIAFLLSSDVLKKVTNCWAKGLVTLALVGFGASAIGGLLVLLQGASNMANAEYDLNQTLVRYPGMANILGLLVGFVFTTLFVIGLIRAE